MAITKIGPPLAGIRGTLGGVIYSANKSGPYARAWAPPSNPRTSKQTTERSFLGEMSTAWRNLSDAQRTAWDTFAALGAQELFNSLGESYYASGFNWFTKCNVRLLRLGRAIISAVPTQARPAAPDIDDFRVCLAGTDEDQCEGGVADASDEEVDLEAENAFDNSTADDDRWQTTEFVTTGWLSYEFAAPRNIKRYRIWPLSVALETSPEDWEFQVWIVAEWVPIHAVTGEAYASSKWYDYYCPNPYAKTKYRINITANQGHASRLSIVEMEMYLADVDGSVICYPENEFDDSPNYDLVLHISQGQTIGKQVQYPGFMEILVTKTPGRWFEVFQDEIESVFGTIIGYRSWFCKLYRQTQEGLRSAPSAERTITIGM